jgi:hypothetical protein
MGNIKYKVNNIKEFFDYLSEILEEYYDGEIDSSVALNKINKLKKVAEEAGIQVNIGENILNHIEPSSSYSYGS